MTPAPAPPAPRALLRLACAGLALAGAAWAQPSDGGFSRDRGGEFGPSLPAVQPVMIYYPPSPPPLGQSIALAPFSSGPSRNAAPPELADFVNECFYPQLGSRLAAGPLAEKSRTRLDHYRAAKRTLQDELRAEFDRLRDAEPEARAAALDALARRQAPRIAALEAEAEQLRRDLGSGDEHWSALREWRLGEKGQRGFSPAEIGQVLRGYAFYENSLLPAQRRLLREIQFEMNAAAPDAANAAAAQPYLFFPPEPARVLLPDDLPADVAAQIASYQTKKSKLKKELYDAVVAYESQRLGFLRPNPLKALAASQAAALAELETLAEEIRRGLARHASPATLAERSPLPPVLQARTAAIMSAIASAQKSATARLNELFAANRDVPMQTAVRFEPAGLRVLIVPSGAGRGRGRSGPAPADSDARLAAIRAAAAAITDDYGRQVAGIVNDLNALRAEIARTLGTTHASAVDQTLNAALRVATARENDPLYAEYRVAVFQPGLSPAQRRLLFDGVIERLALPLPRGEPQPVGRNARW